MANYTVPGLEPAAAEKTIGLLDERLVSLADLSLTLKHIHWNVVGAGFMSAHLMLDDQVAEVRGMVDALAERIATLGGTPVGTPGALVARRHWDDYDLGRATVTDHLVALDGVYSGIIRDHRKAERSLADVDPVSADVLVAHLHRLEQFQWFVRAHLEDAEGVVHHRAEDVAPAR